VTDQTPNVYPYLHFADPETALDWLKGAFGFEERVVHRDGNGGGIQHAELTLGPGIVMLGGGNAGDHGIYVAVDDPDAHYARAKAAGAEILREIGDTDYGSRNYVARDPEGHEWSFGTYRPAAA